MSVGKISEPVGTQTRDVHEWRKSLRSQSPSAGAMHNALSQTTPLHHSRSPSPSSQTGRTGLRSRSPSPSRASIIKHSKGSYLTDVGHLSQKKPTTANALRKSTGSLADMNTNNNNKASKSSEIGNIEAEYIRNLQQQIYFLELEANYLRDQARKATDMHPQMIQEAERMISKLRLMQAEMDNMSVELQRRDSSINIINAEKERLSTQLREEEQARAKDKRLFLDEILTLKTEKDRLERELSHKDEQLLEAKSSIDKSTVALKNAETKIHTLKAQIEQRIEQHKMTQLALDEKRAELVSMETQLREVEDKYYSSTVQIQDKVSQDLRDEIRFLKQKLKETEMNADKDRYLRDKINEDSSHLVRENATLSQQVLELQKQLEREKNLRESNDQRHATSISQVVDLRDKESTLRHEVEQLRDQLKREQDKGKQYLEQLSHKESLCSTIELKLNTSRSKVTELEGMQQATDAEVTQLKRDKVLLVDHVADLQRKIEEKDRSIVELRAEIAQMESRLKQVEFQKSLELSAQSQKWEEFGRLAESMRTLSSTMAQTASPRSKLHQY